MQKKKKKGSPYDQEIVSSNPSNAAVVHGQEPRNQKALWVGGIVLFHARTSWPTVSRMYAEESS